MGKMIRGLSSPNQKIEDLQRQVEELKIKVDALEAMQQGMSTALLSRMGMTDKDAAALTGDATNFIQDLQKLLGVDAALEEETPKGGVAN